MGVELAAALAAVPAGELVLVDSLGTWVSWGLDLNEAGWDRHVTGLLTSLETCRSRVLLVSEQTGWGVVPATAIGGRFRDRLGTLEERLSGQCHHLWLVVAGRALDLLPNSEPVPADTPRC